MAETKPSGDVASDLATITTRYEAALSTERTKGNVLAAVAVVGFGVAVWQILSCRASLSTERVRSQTLAGRGVPGRRYDYDDGYDYDYAGAAPRVRVPRLR